MCGVAGFLSQSTRPPPPEALQKLVARMTDTLRHRGPDDSGCWVDGATGIALGHRRLAILDLSQDGHQPMVSADGDLILVYNGEIYNFLDLRKELASLGHPFHSQSDTEVMLAAFLQWGVEAALRRFNGMFAFALWQQSSRTLYLARDRLGKKPLYYGWMGGTLLFASELKALRAHPDFRAEIDHDVLALYLRHACVPGPYSIYRGVSKLPPGAVLTVPASAGGANVAPVSYWSAADAVAKRRHSPLVDETAALEELEVLLRDAVKLRLISDVPLGAFLSGGIDSTAVVALMQTLADRPARTFTIGFQDQDFDEAPYARRVADHLHTDHTELYVTPAEAMTVIPDMPRLFDEPFADSSQIPTYLVSQLARRSVTVSLSGDGGDELFAGYHAYQVNDRFYSRFGHHPRLLRSLGAFGLRKLPLGDRPGLRFRVQRFAHALSQPTAGQVYAALMSKWPAPEMLLGPVTALDTVFNANGGSPHAGSFIEKMMYLDTRMYLPDDILVKLDRASMAVSLESRCPLLDYRLVEFAWRVPLSMKMRRPDGKWLLRRLAYKFAPAELLDRPKAGFAIPVGEWIRGKLRPWAEELLDPARLRREGFFQPDPIRQVWTEHITGVRDWTARLWIILMFEAWLEECRLIP